MNGADFEQKGLTPAEVVRSREEHGSNQLTHKKRNSFLRQFLSNFGDPIIKVLLVALAVNLIFLFHHFDWYESAGIAIAIFLATFVSTLSEYGSESAFSKLQEDAARLTCRVRRREGLQALPVADVVVGDIVLLQAGERVPAIRRPSTGKPRKRRSSPAATARIPGICWRATGCSGGAWSVRAKGCCWSRR